MDRRGFLWLSALGITAITSPGCADGGSARAPALPSMDYDGFLRRLDRELLAMENPLSTVLKSAASPEDLAQLPPGPRRVAEDAWRKQLRWMTLLGSLRELPPEAQAHPGIQERIREGIVEIDESLENTMNYFDGMSAAERRAFQEKMRSDPTLTDRIVDSLDRDCEQIGIAPTRRLELRQVMNYVGAQLRAQPLSSVIDDNVDKLRKLAVRADEARRRAVLADAPEASGNTRIGLTVIGVGAAGLGAGVLLGAIGAATISGPGIFLITGGVILGLSGILAMGVGLILLLVETATTK